MIFAHFPQRATAVPVPASRRASTSLPKALRMSSLKARLAHIPEGAGVLFFVQMFSTLGFAVLYSTLVLYTTKHLHFSDKLAFALMGVFGAFNYGLHLFGGYLGGRFLSNRNLFVGGMALQVIGCGCIATGSLAMFYVGLAFFLTGSGVNLLHQHDADSALYPGGSASRRSLPLELRRHERRILRRVRRRRLLPGDPELFEPFHLRDARQLCRHHPRRALVEDADRPQHTAARGEVEAIPAAPARRHRHSPRPHSGRVADAPAPRHDRDAGQGNLR